MLPILVRFEETGYCLGNEFLVHDWRQVCQPDAIRLLIQHGKAHLNRQAGLSHPTRANQCHLPGLLEELLYIGDLF